MDRAATDRQTGCKHTSLDLYAVYVTGQIYFQLKEDTQTALPECIINIIKNWIIV